MICYSKRLCLQPVLLLLLFGAQESGTTRAEEVLQACASINVKAQRILDIGDSLSRNFRVPVCVEESRWIWREGRPPQLDDQSEEQQAAGYELMATNAPIESVLNRFVQMYPTYTWTYDKTNGVINLFPREHAPAGWSIAHVSMATQSVEAALFRNDVLGLKNHGIAFNPGRGNMTWVMSTVVTVSGKDIDLRTVLNQICRCFSEPRYWVITELQKPGLMRDGTGRAVRFELQFRRY